MVRTHAGVVVTSRSGHNELLGGHGNDALYAGPWGDVLWADYKPSGQPTTQVDQVFGGNGRDFIYASHGTNMIAAGGGDDWIKAHFGRGHHRLRRRPRPAVHQPQGPAPLHDPPLRADLAQDARPLTTAGCARSTAANAATAAIAAPMVAVAGAAARSPRSIACAAEQARRGFRER